MAFSGRLALLVVVAIASGCSTLLPDGLTDGPYETDAGSTPSTIGSTDASVTDGAKAPDSSDAGTDGSSVDAGADTGPQILYSSSFDLGCADWAVQSALFSTEVTNPRSPSKACRICPAAGSEGDFGAAMEVPGDLGSSPVTVEVNARAAPGSGPMTISLTLYNASQLKRSEGTLTSTYSSVAVQGVATPGTGIFVKSAGAVGDCFLLDDLTISR